MGQITTVGIDLAKNVFSVYGVDANGKSVLRRTVRRAELTQLVAGLPACMIGIMGTCNYAQNNPTH
jgi:transposase